MLTGWIAGGLTTWFLAYALTVGPLPSSDGEWYERAGDLLLERWPDLSGYLETVNYHGAIPVFYVGFTALVGAARALFGAYGPKAITVINALALGCTAFLVLRSVTRIGGSRVSLVVVACLFALCYEQLTWIAFVLSDSTFALLVTIVLCSAITPAPGGGSPAGRLARIWGAALIAPLYRPTGVWLPAWLAVGAISYPLWKEPSVQQRTARLRVLLLVALVVASLLALLLGLLVVSPRPDRPSLLVSALDLVRPSFATGAVVEARPETYTSPPTTAAGVARLIGKRIGYFFVFWADGFSSAHTAANAAVYIPTYVLALVAVAAALSGRRIGVVEQRAIILTALLVLGFAVMHAVTIVDFDWRYRVPVYPALFLLAGLGVRHVEAYVLSARGAKYHEVRE